MASNSVTILLGMTNEGQRKSNTSRVFIDRDDVWEIINNQIEVQQQLSRRGQHILNILSALAVIIVGTTITIDGISNPDVESAVNYLPATQEDLWAFLFINVLFLTLLIFLSTGIFFLFVIRNYYVSRPMSLMPGLGGKDEQSIFVLGDDDYREPETNQYTEWIKSNADILSEKRHQLKRAHKNIVVSIVGFVFCVLLYDSIDAGAIFSILLFDVCLLLMYPMSYFNNSINEWLLFSPSIPLEQVIEKPLRWLDLVESGLYLLIYILILTVLIIFLSSIIIVNFY